MSKIWSDILVLDHQTTERVFEAVSKTLAQPGGPSSKMLGLFRAYVTEYVDGCHNQKEERHLFPLAEQRGIPSHGGPLAVMLAEHAQSRELLTKLAEQIDAYTGGQDAALTPLRAVFTEYTELLKGHFWKETDILYPMVRRMMSPEDAAAVLAGIETVEASVGPDTRQKYYALADEICALAELADLSAGLSPPVLAAMLNTLPVELSFVDADDVVRYFSHEHHAKIFPRTRGAVGRRVQQCHPPKSVHLVSRILADFKAGSRDVAEFWIDFGEKKIHVRYFPVRSPEGTYLGCLEVVQDIAPIQALTGQRRLLDDA